MERSPHLPHRSPGGDPRVYGLSPSMAPADMIRMSFDQIYRATPVNPILAQQLRRQQQAAIQPMGTFMGPPAYASPPSSSSIQSLGISTVHNASPGMTSISGTSPHRFQSPPYPSEQSQQQIAHQSQPVSFSSPPKPAQDRNSVLPPHSFNNPSTGTSGMAPAASVASMLPPPPVAGGSRSRRMASSSMDTLLALGGKKPIAAAVPGAVPSIRPPDVPSSSSVARNADTSTHQSLSRSKSAPSLPVPTTKASGQSSRKSFGGRVQQPQTSKAVAETAPASPPTTTRSGRVSKPVSRIVREMDNPASSTSYTVVKAVGHDGKSIEDARERRKSFPQRTEDAPVTTTSIPKHELLGNMNPTAHPSIDRSKDQEKTDRGASVTKQDITKGKSKRHLDDEDEDFVDERPVANPSTNNKVSKKKELSVGDKLQAMIAEADKTLASVHSMDATDETRVVSKKSKPWSPTEVVALYAVYNKTDVTLPNCWQLISERLQREKNILRTEEECKEKWFSALQDVKKRQERMHQKKKQNQVEAALQKLQTINEQAAEKLGMKIAETALQGDLSLSGKGHGKKRKANGSVKMSKDDQKNEEGPDDEAAGSSEDDSDDNNEAAAAAAGPGTKGKKATANMKRPRLGKNDLKALAEHSSKATKEDDVFESASFQNHLQQQKQKKLSAVAQYLQQQQQKKAIPSPFRNETAAAAASPFPSSAAVISSSPLPTSTAASLANTSPTVINTLAVRKKSTSAMNTTPGGSTSLPKSPVSSRLVPDSAKDATGAGGGGLAATSTDDLFDDLPTVATPTSRRGPLKAAGSSNGDDEDDEDDDALFATRVVQKIKRVKPSVSSATLHTKKRHSLGGKKPKAITSVREITKEIHHAMKKVRSTFSDSELDEEEQLPSDADDMDIDDF